MTTALGGLSGSHWLTDRRLWSFAVSQKVLWFMAASFAQGRCSV